MGFFFAQVAYFLILDVVWCGVVWCGLWFLWFLRGYLWGGDISKITYTGSNALDYTYGIDLRTIHANAWGGIIPSELTKLVRELLTSSDHSHTKNGALASKIVGQMNGLASSAICEIWEMRKIKLNDNAATPKRNALQTCQEQAKALADQNKLPGPGGTGTMTYLDFLGMPPKHQKNKMSKVLRELNGMTNPRDVVHYLPTIGQNVRSYVPKNDGT